MSECKGSKEQHAIHRQDSSLKLVGATLQLDTLPVSYVMQLYLCGTI